MYRVVAFLVVALALGAAATARAQTVVTSSLVGAEVPPISSTRGTFVGVATGDREFSWRTQIVHEPLRTGSTVAITGGTFSLLTMRAKRVVGNVTGGSVSVLDRGARCTNQLYKVETFSTVGVFVGTLTHFRRKVLGRCIVYSATISGHGTFNL